VQCWGGLWLDWPRSSLQAHDAALHSSLHFKLENGTCVEKSSANTSLHFNNNSCGRRLGGPRVSRVARVGYTAHPTRVARGRHGSTPGARGPTLRGVGRNMEHRARLTLSIARHSPPTHLFRAPVPLSAAPGESWPASIPGPPSSPSPAPSLGGMYSMAPSSVPTTPVRRRTRLAGGGGGSSATATVVDTATATAVVPELLPEARRLAAEGRGRLGLGREAGAAAEAAPAVGVAPPLRRPAPPSENDGAALPLPPSALSSRWRW
jgi:hypothetical protein